MKIPAGRADAFVRRPDAAVRAVLVYGPDGGLVRERAELLVRGVVDPPTDPFRTATLAAAELAKAPGRLADEAAALSLTGGRRAIRVREAGDGVTAAVKQALAGPPADSLIVLEAGDLSARSSLRKLCETAANAAAVPCYLAEAGDIARLARTLLGEAGLDLDRDAEAYLAENLTGDRQLARREIEKLIAYAGGTRRIDLDAAQACIGDSAQQSLDDVALAAADGDLDALDRVLGKLLAEGVSAIAILRAVQRHIARLHLAAARVGGGESAEEVMKALNVFFKAQDRFRGQLRRWSLPRLAEALARLVEAEAECKRTNQPAETICARTLLQVALLVQRPG